jgi:hypothetical protein
VSSSSIIYNFFYVESYSTFWAIYSEMQKLSIWKYIYIYICKEPVHISQFIFRDIAPCNQYKNHSFGGKYYLHHQGKNSTEQETSVSLGARTLISCSPDFILKIEVICSSETSVHILTTQRYIPKDGNFCNFRCENIRSYTLHIWFPETLIWASVQ